MSHRYPTRMQGTTVSDEKLPDNREPVRALLAAAGLSPAEGEIEQIADQYPLMRALFDLMWMPSDVRYERPAMVFRPDLDR